MSSSSFEIRFPKYVSYRIPDQEFYKDMVRKDSNTPFSGLHMSNVFIYSMCLGFITKRKTQFQKDERSNSLPARAFDEQMRWLMRALAASDTGSLETVLDHNKVVEIAESYANTGIDILKELRRTQRQNNDDHVYEEHLRDHY